MREYNLVEMNAGCWLEKSKSIELILIPRKTKKKGNITWTIVC